VTENIYRRARIFDSDRFKLKFVRTLDDLRAELSFRIIGYVLMPEHCHLLIVPSDLADPSQIMQKLAERTANFVLRNLRQNLEQVDSLLNFKSFFFLEGCGKPLSF
jgi:REP element-mobilizing transposase RayT